MSHVVKAKRFDNVGCPTSAKDTGNSSNISSALEILKLTAKSVTTFSKLVRSISTVQYICFVEGQYVQET